MFLHPRQSGSDLLANIRRSGRGENTLDGQLNFFQVVGGGADAGGNQLINFCLKFGDFHRNLVAFIRNSGKNFIS